MAKTNEALNKQVAEVRRYVETRLAGEEARMDKRIGHALSVKGVTKQYSSDWGAGSSYYYLNCTPKGQLVPSARNWFEANGLKDLADAFDAMMLKRYVDENTQRLQKRRAELQVELDHIDQQLKQYEALLPIQSNNR